MKQFFIDLTEILIKIVELILSIPIFIIGILISIGFLILCTIITPFLLLFSLWED